MGGGGGSGGAVGAGGPGPGPGPGPEPNTEERIKEKVLTLDSKTLEELLSVILPVSRIVCEWRMGWWSSSRGSSSSNTVVAAGAGRERAGWRGPCSLGHQRLWADTCAGAVGGQPGVVVAA